MKKGWERSNELIVLDKNLATEILKPFLKEKFIVKLQPLSGGLNNSNLKITTNTGENYVLRLYSKNDNKGSIENQILSILEDVIPVPRILHADLSCSTYQLPFILLSWVQGDQLSKIISLSNDKMIAALGEEIGLYLAKIHTIQFPSPGFFNKELNVQEHIKIDADRFIMYIEESTVSGYAVDHIGEESTNKWLHFVKAHANLLNDIGQQKSLVHSDFNPLNILIDLVEDRAKVTSILDWEYAFSGTPLFDIGNMLRYEEVTRSKFLSPFIKSYQENGGILPERWLQKAKLLDLIALCGLLNKKECGEERVSDIKRLIEETINGWENLDFIQNKMV